MTMHFQVMADYSGKVSEKPYFVTDLPTARRAALQDGASKVFRVRQINQNQLTQQVIGREYAILLLRTISFQVDAGISPVKATYTAIESETDPSKRARLQGAVDALTRGASLADALHTTGLYDTTVHSMMSAGERIGGSAAITAAMEYLDDKKSTWKAYGVAIGMIFMELSTALTLPPSINSLAIPWIRANLPKSSPGELLAYQQQLDSIEFNNLVWMWVSFGACAVVTGMVIAWLVNPKYKAWLTDNVLVRMPLLSDWYTNDALARSSKIFASMLMAGVRINDAMHTIIKTTSNGIARRFWQTASDALKAGSIPGVAFASSGILRADELLVLNAARGNRQIAKSFALISEDRTWRKKKLTSHIFRMSLVFMVAYVVITMLIGFRLFNLFNAGLEMSMNSMTQGI